MAENNNDIDKGKKDLTAEGSTAEVETKIQLNINEGTVNTNSTTTTAAAVIPEPAAAAIPEPAAAAIQEPAAAAQQISKGFKIKSQKISAAPQPISKDLLTFFEKPVTQKRSDDRIPITEVELTVRGTIFRGEKTTLRRRTKDEKTSILESNINFEREIEIMEGTPDASSDSKKKSAIVAKENASATTVISSGLVSKDKFAIVAKEDVSATTVMSSGSVSKKDKFAIVAKEDASAKTAKRDM